MESIIISYMIKTLQFLQLEFSKYYIIIRYKDNIKSWYYYYICHCSCRNTTVSVCELPHILNPSTKEIHHW